MGQRRPDAGDGRRAGIDRDLPRGPALAARVRLAVLSVLALAASAPAWGALAAEGEAPAPLAAPFEGDKVFDYVVLALATFVAITACCNLLVAFGLVPSSPDSRVRKVIVFIGRLGANIRTRTSTGSGGGGGRSGASGGASGSSGGGASGGGGSSGGGGASGGW